MSASNKSDLVNQPDALGLGSAGSDLPFRLPLRSGNNTFWTVITECEYREDVSERLKGN